MKKFLRGLFIVLLVLALLYAVFYYFFLKEPEKEPFEVLYEEEKVSNLAGVSISPAEPLVLQVNYLHLKNQQKKVLIKLPTFL